jgi:flagellar basal body-associated protein FliL
MVDKLDKAYQRRLNKALVWIIISIVIVASLTLLLAYYFLSRPIGV